VLFYYSATGEWCVHNRLFNLNLADKVNEHSIQVSTKIEYYNVVVLFAKREIFSPLFVTKSMFFYSVQNLF
jgi:hypothetical protein